MPRGRDMEHARARVLPSVSLAVVRARADYEVFRVGEVPF